MHEVAVDAAPDVAAELLNHHLLELEAREGVENRAAD
jgi:hypothetical protein